MRKRLLLPLVVALGSTMPLAATPATLSDALLFVTQVPLPMDAQKVKLQPNPVTALFANHTTDPARAPRGGDLYLRKADGTLVNLTATATPTPFGTATGFQGASAIAVRDPAVSFDAKKALFSMVVGAPSAPGDGPYYWQIYEVTNLDLVISSGAAPAISKLANQPATSNNIYPSYAANGKVIFVSDFNANGAHLVPQLDEYVCQPTNTGVWSLDPTDASSLAQLDASPSGDFAPFVDSFGRIILTRWDHLQRDALADADFHNPGSPPNGAFNFDTEDPNAAALADTSESFPAPQGTRSDLLQPHEVQFEFNLFFPWMLDQDGGNLETINHIGRHELVRALGPAFDNDSNIVGATYANLPGQSNPLTTRSNGKWLQSGMLQIRELPTAAGTYIGIDASETGTQGAGQIVELAIAPAVDPDDAVAAWVTPWAGKFVPSFPSQCSTGYYRDPAGLSDGTIVAAFAGESSPGSPINVGFVNNGTATSPAPNYQFRLMTVTSNNTQCPGFKGYDAPLTGGIVKSLSYFDGAVTVHGDTGPGVTLWEIEPVPVIAHGSPALAPTHTLPATEMALFGTGPSGTGVDFTQFQQWLVTHDLALIVGRNITTRDHADRQQPWQLVVQQPGGAQTPSPATVTPNTIPPGQAVYPVKYLQIFQGDLERAYGGAATLPANRPPGRRVHAKPLHDGGPHLPPSDGSAPAGTVEIEADGSWAALVPAHRALSWQLIDDTGAPKVRERYWVSFGRGETRVCTSCHGINTTDQQGNAAPTNPPSALTNLLLYWKSSLFSDDFEALMKRWSAFSP
jgi:hypothetical protein